MTVARSCGVAGRGKTELQCRVAGLGAAAVYTPARTLGRGAARQLEPGSSNNHFITSDYPQPAPTPSPAHPSLPWLHEYRSSGESWPRTTQQLALGIWTMECNCGHLRTPGTSGHHTTSTSTRSAEQEVVTVLPCPGAGTGATPLHRDRQVSPHCLHSAALQHCSPGPAPVCSVPPCPCPGTRLQNDMASSYTLLFQLRDRGGAAAAARH